MKILVISHEYPPIGGGGANACSFLGKEFAKGGHEVTLVTVYYEGLKEYETTGEGVKIYRVKSRRKHKEHCSFPEMADFVIKATKKADELCRENKYDICQIYFGIPSGPVGVYLKMKYKLPYVVRFGGGDIPGFQERFGFIYKLIGPFVKIIWKEASALVANSEGLQKFAYGFCDKYPVEVIPNGVDTSVYYPLADKREEKESVELLFVSRLIERKGLQNLIPYLNEIEARTEKKVHLTIVGDGPYRETLEKITAESGVLDKVTFLGQKDKHELPELYRLGDVFVFPSKREGMPNAVLEAMASGLAIVMTPCEGAKELVDGNGIIAYNDFQSQISEVILSGQIKEMGKCSRQRAESIFSWKSVADGYLEIFNKTIGKSI